MTHGERDCELWIASGGSLIVEDRKYGTWLRAPLSNQIRKSAIVVPGFYQQKKAPGASTDEEREPVSKPSQSATSAKEISMTSTVKVTPKSVLPIFSCSVACPSIRDGEEIALGFEGQIHTKGNFPHTPSTPEEKQCKGDVMDEGVGNLELIPREGCENPKNLRRVDSNVTGAWGLEGQEGKSSSLFTLYMRWILFRKKVR